MLALNNKRRMGSHTRKIEGGAWFKAYAQAAMVACVDLVFRVESMSMDMDSKYKKI
jgi:hypothetical protein